MGGQENLVVPHDRVITSLEHRLHAAISELAMKDAAIEQLRADLEAARAAIRAQAPAETGAALPA